MEINKKIINDSVFDKKAEKISFSSVRGQLNCSLCKNIHSKCKSDPLKDFYNFHPGMKSDSYDRGALFIIDTYPTDDGKLFKDRDVASLLNSLLVEHKIDNYYLLPSVKCDVEKLGLNTTAKVKDNCFELSKLIIKEKLKPKVVVTDSIPVFNQITGLKFVSAGRVSNSIGWSSELNCYVMILLRMKTLIEDKRISEEKVIESVRLANLKKGFSLIKTIISDEYKEHIIRHDNSKINYRKLTLSSPESEINEYFNKLYSASQAAVDIETTGLNVFFDKITMMSITMEVGEAMNFSKEFMDAHRDKFQKFFSSALIEKIFANGSFDVSFLIYDGYTFDGKLTDIQVYNYLNRNGLDYDVSLSGIKYSSKNKGKSTNTLKFLSWIYTDLGGYETKIRKQGGIVEVQKKLTSKKSPKSKKPMDENLDLFQEVIKANIHPQSKLTLADARNVIFEGEIVDNSLTDAEIYNCTDTDATFRIKLLLVDKSEERVRNVYEKLLGPLIFEVLTNIYLKGIRVDLKYLDELKLKYKGSEDGTIIGLIDQIKNSFEIELKNEIVNSGKFNYDDIVKLYPEESQFDKDNAEKDLEKLLKNIDININSSKQILAIYKKLGYLESGADSVDGDVLDFLSNKGIKSAEYKAKYQPVNKLYTTYILPFIEKNIDGYLHSSYQTNLVTGRLSSSDPNMQNIPAENEIRNICIAREGYSYIDMDYSAAELRVLAEVSDQEDWIEGFKNDFDPHWAMAKKMFNIPLVDRPKIDKMQSLIDVGDWLVNLGYLKPGFNINDQNVVEIVTSKIRELEKKRGSSKTVNFAVAYGSGAKGIAEQLYPDFKFVKKDHQRKYIEEARGLIDAWFKAANKIKKWLDDTHIFAKNHKYVETILGRRRYLVFADSNYKQFSAAAMREAGNTPIQSAASDMCAYASVLIQRHIRNFPKDDCRIVNIVHDNIMLEVPDHRVDYYAPIAVDLMQNKANLLKRVPMKVDYQVTKKWVK